jgi:hypothetical protein
MDQWIVSISAFVFPCVFLLARKVAFKKRDEISTAPSIKDEILRRVREKVFIDETSRLLFIEEQALTIERLISGELIGQTGYRRALLGRKGVGKTTLLEALWETCKEMNLRKYGLHLVYISVEGSNSTCCSPFSGVLSSLSLWYRLSLLWKYIRYRCTHFAETHSLMKIVDQFLEENGLFVFGIMDEFQNVYKGDNKKCESILNEMFAIGDSRKGRFHWILSGSSTSLRTLITAKLRECDKPLYPCYTAGVDLNGQKFQFRTINPFLKKDEFKQYLTFKGNKNSSLFNVYLSTGGVPRLIDDLLKKSCLDSYSPAYSVTTKDYLQKNRDVDQSNILLKAIAEVLSLFNVTVTNHSDEDDRLDAACAWTQMVSLTQVKNRFYDLCKRGNSAERQDISFSPSLCYELADKGCLVYNDTEQEGQIGFLSPLFFYSYFLEESKISFDEMLALKSANSLNPSNTKNNDVAGDATLKLIARKAVGNSDRFSNMMINDVSILDGIPLLNYDKVTTLDGIIVNCMHKEACCSRDGDSLGADGVVINVEGVDDDGRRRVVVHRIQVKITENLLEEKVKQVFERFNTNYKLVDEKLLKIFPENDFYVVQKWILATTGNLSPILENYLATKSITVWNKQFLAELVWTPDIKLLGSKFNSNQRTISIRS